MDVKLTHPLIAELSRPFVGMVKEIVEFYKDPQNKEAYREWYVKKYGVEPENEV